MKKNGTTLIGTTINDEEILQKLIDVTQGTFYSQWLRVVWNNPGILTHELVKHGLQSNNHHDCSQKLNQRIEALGYKVIKKINTKPNESWSWFVFSIDLHPAPQLSLAFDSGAPL